MQYYHYYWPPSFDISNESHHSYTLSSFNLKADSADYFNKFHIAKNILNAYNILIRKSEGKWAFQWVDISVDGRIILMDLMELGYEDDVNWQEFLNHLSNYQLLKNTLLHGLY
jgi:hypothetical protein